MQGTYKAVEVYEPSKLRVVERSIPEPGAGQVRIRVEACGICHTDAATVTGTYPGLNLPRVPGHEVVGRIEALGSGVSRWKVSQRVGGGFFGGEDGVCEPCRRGDIVNCQNPVTPGVTTDGGYAEVMIVAIGRGSDKEKLAKDLGGHIYIDTAVDDAVAVLQRMGGKRIAFCPACDHHR